VQLLSCLLTTIMSLSDSSISSGATVVPLSSRPSTSVKPPVWLIDDSVPGVHIPPATGCARSTREGGVCCKDLIEERTLVDPDVVRDV
jgi:vacuolar iron transporter family protein